MDIQSLVEDGKQKGLFPDFDVCVKGQGVNLDYSGGDHVLHGARFFDVASLTKACTHLVYLKLFSEGILSPGDSFTKFIGMKQCAGDDRKLYHFLCYTAREYGFDHEDYKEVRSIGVGDLKQYLVSRNFGRWNKTFMYDNVASAYLGVLLERILGKDLEQILVENLLSGPEEKRRFVFHPVARGIITRDEVVPTRQDPARRGLVHDPLTSKHAHQNLSVAGIFTDASMLCLIFERVVDQLIESSWYDEVSENWLERIGINTELHGLGFDIPKPGRFVDVAVEKPLLFTGYTGCRIFFSKKPRITLCLLTNRVLYHSGPANDEFRTFCWDVIREALRCAGG